MGTSRTLFTISNSLLVGFCLTVASLPARADITVELGTPVTGAPNPTVIGNLSYAGGLNPLLGNHILINTLVGTDGVTTYTVDALLNFQTGAFQGLTATGSLIFGPGGSTISIDGTVPGFITPSENLLSGSLFGAIFDPIVGNISLTFAAGPDVKSADLLNLVHLPLTTQFDAAAFVVTNQIANPTGGFTADVYTADVINHVVPEPSAVLLLLTVVVGLAGTFRARTRRLATAQRN